MTPLPTPESLSAILVRPRSHARGSLVPLSNLTRVPVIELRRIYGTSVAIRLAGLTGGMVSTRTVLSRAAAAQGLETVHGTRLGAAYVELAAERLIALDGPDAHGSHLATSTARGIVGAWAAAGPRPKAEPRRAGGAR